MARKIGSMTMKNSLEPTVGAPLDGRLQVKVKEDLYAEGSYPKYYNGMIVSVKNNGDAYKLSGVPTNEEDWKKLLTEDDLAGYQPTITVDGALSDTSENPVQNKVIKAAIDAAGSGTEYEYSISWDGRNHDLIINEGTDDEQKLRLSNVAFPGGSSSPGSYDDTELVARVSALEAKNVPTKTSELQNDSGYITSEDVPDAYDDTDLVNRVTALEESSGSGGSGSSYDDTELKARIEALEAKLADYAEVTLKMSDGTNEVDKLILAKDKATPKPVYTNMFDLPEGFYDAEGNFVASLGAYLDWETYSEDYDDYYGNFRFNQSLPDNVVGMVIEGACQGDYTLHVPFPIYNAPSGKLQWLVIKRYEHVEGDGNCYATGFEQIADVPDFVTTIYYDIDVIPDEPWGQTGAEVNITGTPLYWEG